RKPAAPTAATAIPAPISALLLLPPELFLVRAEVVFSVSDLVDCSAMEDPPSRCGSSGTAGLKFLRLWPVFEDFDETAEPCVRLVAVNHAVVDGERHIGHWPDKDRVLPADLAHNHALLEL